MKIRIPITEVDSMQFAEVRMRKQRGFSFTEILFAVMILGIGFIMVAAMFPVAIRQTEANNQETIISSLGHAGAGYLQQVAQVPWPPGAAASVIPTSLLIPTFAAFPTTAVMPPGTTTVVIPGQTWSMFDNRDTVTYTSATLGTVTHKNVLWSAVSNNLIQPGDPRYAWIGMYRRDAIAQQNGTVVTVSPAPYAQVIVIGVESRAKPQYVVSADIANPPTPAGNPPLLPVRLTRAKLVPQSGATPSTVTFNANSVRLADNAYIVIADDKFPDPVTGFTGRFNGRVYRLGTNIGGLTWQMAPGNEMDPTDPTLNSADVFIIGRGRDASGNVAGLAQDVSVYTTFVQISN